MPNDRNSSSILSNNKLANYATLAKHLSNSSQISKNKKSSDDKKDKEMESLEVLESLISQNMASESQQKADSSVQPVVGNRTKEVVESKAVPEKQVENAVESKTEENVEQVAENPEIAELSKEIKEVSKESREQREAAEIKEKQQAINELAQEAANNPPVAIQDDNPPVVVLPITEEDKKEARTMTTKSSLKWLVEWAEKISKIFSGAVVYKEELDQSEDV